MNDRLPRWLGRALLVLGAGFIAAWLGVTLESRAVQAGLARRLEAFERGPRPSSPSEAVRLTRNEADTTGLIGRIEIPRLGISAMVLEGTNGRALRRGVGHIQRTALPGESGNVGLAAHRDTYFRDLEDVETGDLIRLTTPGGEYDYQVDSILVVAPDRGDLLDDTGGAELTLVTCYPFYWVGPAPRRFVIRASPSGGQALVDR